MTSTLILYKDTKIVPERNLIVDSIADYLATISTKLKIDDFQFQRHQLELDIKVDLSQSYQEYNSTYNYNYCSIQDGITGEIVYYFIINKRQVAQSTIALHLLMDTANTFNWNTDYTPTRRTKVIREHKDRYVIWYYGFEVRDVYFNNIYNTFPYSDETPFPISIEVDDGSLTITGLTAEYFDDGNHTQLRVYGLSLEKGKELIDYIIDNNVDSIDFWNGDDSIQYCNIPYPTDVGETQLFYWNKKYVRKIDYYNEGIQVPLFKRELGDLTHNEDSTWNLIYKDAGSDIIECSCIPSNDGINVDISTPKGLIYTDFDDGYYYYFLPYTTKNYVENQAVLLDNDSIEYKIGKYSSAYNLCVGAVVHRTGATLQIRKIKGDLASGFGLFSYLSSWKTITSLSFAVENIYYKKFASTQTEISKTPTTYFTTTYSSEVLTSLSEIDRADGQLIKIISIPYFPTNYEYDENTNTMSVDNALWDYNSGRFILDLLSTKFTSTIVSTIDSPLDVFVFNTIPTSIQLRNDTTDGYESKLYHSEFYYPKFVYDSFGFIFKLEAIDVNKFVENYSSKFTFEFIMTSTINSKFMFRFPEYQLYMSTEDYDNILSISRNNEATIYNSPYYNYLVQARRYDLKAIEYRERSQILGLMSGTFNNTAGAIKSAFKEDWLGMAGNIISQITSTINTITSFENDINSQEAKENALKYQRASVSGSDDLDLLEAYSNNRAKLVIYEVPERIKKLLADLFYYYGYLTNEMKVPLLNTRKNFNYIQCELDLEDTGSNIPQELITDLKQRFASGITILHKVNSSWDFALKQANWEVSLL